MKAHIYQIDLKLDDKRICFMSYETVSAQRQLHFRYVVQDYHGTAKGHVCVILQKERTAICQRDHDSGYSSARRARLANCRKAVACFHGERHLRPDFGDLMKPLFHFSIMQSINPQAFSLEG